MSVATSETIIFPFNLSPYTSHIEVSKSIQLFCRNFLESALNDYVEVLFLLAVPITPSNHEQQSRPS